MTARRSHVWVNFREILAFVNKAVNKSIDLFYNQCCTYHKCCIFVL